MQTYEALITLCETLKYNVDPTQADRAIKNTRTRTDLWGGTSTPKLFTTVKLHLLQQMHVEVSFNAGGELRFSLQV